MKNIEKNKMIYERILNGEVVYLTNEEMSELDDYCFKIGDTVVVNNYISDDHIGDGVYRVYI